MENDRKNGLLTFIFSFIPGAGEMYLGLMRKGLVLMTIFLGFFGITALVRSEVFMVFCPLIWFYSFFDTMHLKYMTAEQKRISEQYFLDALDTLFGRNWNRILGERKKAIGYVCIFFGLYMVLENFVRPILYRLWDEVPEYLYWILNNFSTVLVAIGIIYLGLHLIKGEKPIKKDEDLIEYRGEKNGRES